MGKELATKIIENDKYEKILIIDRIKCSSFQLSSKLTIEICDILNEDSLLKLMSQFKPHIVVHLASAGMSGSSMLDKHNEEININGTKNIISCSRKVNVKLLIYTSTYNVIYGGREISNGDESLPYFPLELHTDCYSRSKAIAEMLVRDAHGKHLSTCVIRPAAIYGQEEQRHFPRIVKYMDSGMFLFTIGKAAVDWVHVDNLVQAFLLAMSKYSSSSTQHAAPVYFISDGAPIDNFEFLRPLCETRGYTMPTVCIPVTLALGLAYCMETVYYLSRAFHYPVAPFMTRAEVYKVGVTHNFSIDKARRELGYSPSITSTEGSHLMAKRYREVDWTNYFSTPSAVWWISINIGMLVLAVSALGPDDYATSLSMSSSYLEMLFVPAKYLGYAIFRSQTGLQVVLALAVAAHVCEGIYAGALTRRLGCSNTWHLWAIQTLLLGFASLKLINERRAFVSHRMPSNSKTS